MPFKGTDRKAYEKASKGKTPNARSRIYKREKAKNELINQLKMSFSNREKRSKNSNVVNHSILPTGFKKDSSFASVKSKNKVKSFSGENKKQKNVKYIPKQLILDDIREYRSSKIISNVSNVLATFIMKTATNKKIDNYQKNLIRSSVALITSEVINKSLEKPLRVIDNIKLFIKVGKVVYKMILWFNEKIQNYEVKENSINKSSIITSEYRTFMKEYPQIKEIDKLLKNYWQLLGKSVKITIDRPIGFIDSKISQLMYTINYGYIKQLEYKNVCIVGVDKPIKSFIGNVIAVLYKKNNIKNILIIVSERNDYSIEEIEKEIKFKERIDDYEIIK